MDKDTPFRPAGAGFAIATAKPSPEVPEFAFKAEFASKSAINEIAGCCGCCMLATNPEHVRDRHSKPTNPKNP